MQKIFMACCLLIITGFGFGQDYQPVESELPLSFRSQAAGGTIPDHLDLVYDPIELSFVKGTHLFTNLSNLTSGEEQIFNGVSDNAFLLGIASRNRYIPNLWSAFLVTFRDTRENGPVAIDANLDGFIDIEESGDFENLYNAFLDLDNDGLYDVEQLIRQRQVNFPRHNQLMLTLNNSILAGGWTYGFRLRYGRYEERSSLASGVYGSGSGPLFGVLGGDPTYSLNFDVDRVNLGLPLFSQDESGDFDNSSRRRFWDFSLAMMNYFNIANVEKVELRFDAGIRGENRRLQIDDSYSGSYANYNNSIFNFQDRFLETQSDATDQEEKANGFFAGMSGKKVLQEAEDRRDDSFWKVGGFYQRMELDYRYRNDGRVNRDRDFFDGLDTLAIDLNTLTENQLTIADDGSGTAQTLSIYGNFVYQLGEQVTLGMAARYRYLWVDRSSEYRFSNMGDVRFVQVDNTSANDYRATTEESYAADRDFTIRRHDWRLPVGVEYRFSESRRWALRLGAIFNYVRERSTDRFDITDQQPRIITRAYDNGAVDIELTDDVFEAERLQQNSRASATIYTYGLGYKATEALQIDLIGFFGNDADSDLLDTDFWRSLRLSVGLRL